MKVLALMVVMAMIWAASLLVMVYGWGLWPQSWAAVVGGYLAIMGLQVVTTALGK
jgi:hypothetical protein